MGNVETSPNGDFHGNVTAGHLSRKHASSRSLRLSGSKQQQQQQQQVTRRSQNAGASSAAKQEHRNSEASTRSSSTPSIPQSLAESGLEPFDPADALGCAEFGANPHWTQRVAMTLRPESFQHDDDDEALATPTPETSEADTLTRGSVGVEDSSGEG